MWTLLLQAFDGPGASVLYAILLVGSFVGAVAIERTRALWSSPRTDPAALRAALRRDDLPALRAALADDALAEVVRAGLSEPEPELAWEAMSAAAAEVEQRLFRRLAALLTAGTTATMLGLLGTVLGLIVAFSSLDDAAQRAARLSDGVGAAMSSTALGLVVGIVATVLHGLLDARARQLQADIEVVARELVLHHRRAAR
jgi:biopolymer transport protein ExbB